MSVSRAAGNSLCGVDMCRTGAVEEARRLVEMFGWSQYFRLQEIYPGDKTSHFVRSAEFILQTFSFWLNNSSLVSGESTCIHHTSSLVRWSYELSMPSADFIGVELVIQACFWIRARSETVCAGMVYRHFFGRLESHRHLFLADCHTGKFGQLIVRKIIKIVCPDAFPGCKICQKCVCSRGSTPDPAGGAYSTPQTP